MAFSFAACSDRAVSSACGIGAGSKPPRWVRRREICAYSSFSYSTAGTRSPQVTRAITLTRSVVGKYADLGHEPQVAQRYPDVE